MYRDSPSTSLPPIKALEGRDPSLPGSHCGTKVVASDPPFDGNTPAVADCCGDGIKNPGAGGGGSLFSRGGRFQPSPLKD